MPRKCCFEEVGALCTAFLTTLLLAVFVYWIAVGFNYPASLSAASVPLR